MCGVAGVYAYCGSAPAVDREELRTMRDHMAARGPDGSGEWFSADGRVGLGHRRLAIIDLSERASQPMASADATALISFNGEIYNYRELRANLQARGRTFRSESDTEVLLQLYDEYGTAMLNMVRGMFAFALWDGRQRAMLLARDPFGIKPLYYADDGRTLRVASQVKALLKAPVDASPEPAGHAGFFLWGSVPGPWTLYRGIRSLQPGHFMWVGQRGAQLPQPYCLITEVLAQAAANPARGTEQEAIEQIASALQASVKAHLVADVPVGVFLSAGLDSAMLASLTAATGAQLRTMTLGFAEYAGTANDEAPQAESLSRQLNACHTTATVRRADFEAERDKLLAAMDQPSIDGVNTWFVARAAAAQGIKVALSGLGGDEIFASYPSFREVPLLAGLARPFARVPGLGVCVRRLSEPLLRRVTSPKYAGLLEYGGSLGAAYLLRRGLHMPWELPRLMEPDMARAGWRDLQPLAQLDATVAASGGETHSRLAVSALEMTWYMRHQLLNDADWAGMAHSLEIRTPLVDIDLLKAAAPWIAAHPQVTKHTIARAVAPALSEEALHKPKTGFTIPVHEWLGAPAMAKRRLRGWSRLVHDGYAAGQSTRAPSLPGPSGAPRVLVSTLAPGNGGVSAMTSFVVRSLAARGLEPVLAHYAPYSVIPALSAPFYRLLQRRPGSRRGAYDGHEIHAIGAWLPELEFTHYAATRHWRELMDSCDAFVAVSGNVLAATPFLQTGRPYLAWVATDWQGDRADRVKHFPLVRRLLDRCVNGPIIRRLEKRLLTSGHIISLSDYTAGVLAGIAGPRFRKVLLPVAVDSSLFIPAPARVVSGRLGFAGRFNDPRKNIGLLLAAAALLRRQGQDVSVVLMGDAPTPAILREVARLGLSEHVRFEPALSRLALRNCLQTLDVFVLPSHQEGLCIAALEAMACGVPVVSTRCGGPEEFVISDATGYLANSNAAAMARAVASIIGNNALRSRLSQTARQMARDRYSAERVEAIFASEFSAAFPDLGVRRVAPEIKMTPMTVGDPIG